MQIDTNIVETWIRGWALARGVAAPEKDSGGFRVDVKWPRQLRRYVFTEPNEGFIRLANTISEPWIFLKVCASPETIGKLLPAGWRIQAPGFMMTCFRPMVKIKTELPHKYTLDLEENISLFIARILTPKGDVAAIGRVVITGGYAVYDRIETKPEYRRKGLASKIMQTLESVALTHGATKGLLVATPEGKIIYEKLGWEVYTPYTTAVIPGPANTH